MTKPHTAGRGMLCGNYDPCSPLARMNRLLALLVDLRRRAQYLDCLVLGARPSIQPRCPERKLIASCIRRPTSMRTPKVPSPWGVLDLAGDNR